MEGHKKRLLLICICVGLVCVAHASTGWIHKDWKPTIRAGNLPEAPHQAEEMEEAAPDEPLEEPATEEEAVPEEQLPPEEDAPASQNDLELEATVGNDLEPEATVGNKQGDSAEQPETAESPQEEPVQPETAGDDVKQ